MQFSWKIFSDAFFSPSILDLQIIKTHVLDFLQNGCAIFSLEYDSKNLH